MTCFDLDMAAQSVIRHALVSLRAPSNGFGQAAAAALRLIVLFVLLQATSVGSALAATTCADIKAGAFDASGADHQSDTTVSLTAGDIITLNYTFVVDTTFFYGIELGVGGHYADGSNTVSGTLHVTVTTTGAQIFAWRALSEGLPSQIDVTVTCSGTTSAPVANPVSATVAQNSSNNPVTLDITGAVATSVAVSASASHGTATASGTSITYTPANGYSGADSFTYTASNAAGTSSPATVSITVKSAGPVVTSASPAAGLVAGHQTTIVTGQQLTGATSVQFGGVNVLGFQVLSATQITVVTPPHAAGTVDVTVTTPLGSATGTGIYRYTAMPDPTADPTVKAMVDFQVHTVQVMGQQQIDNVQDRLTELHNDDVPVVSNRASFAQIPAPQRPYGPPAGAEDKTGAAANPAQTRHGPKDAPATAVSDSPLRYWTAGSLLFGQDTTYASAKYNVVSTGLTAGVDTRLTRNLKAGVAVGFGIDHATIGSDGSHINANVWSTQAYASYRAAPQWFIDGILGYAAGRLGNYRYDSSALAFGSGHRGADDLFGSLAVSREIKLDRWKIAPYARLDLQWIRLDGYAESGAGIYNLTFNRTSAVDLAGMLGTRFTHVMDTSAGLLKSSFELTYRRSFSGSYTQLIAYNFDPTTTYSLFGLAEKRDQALIGLGFELQVNRSVSLGVQLDELIANNARNERGRAHLKIGF
ncbi:autotransporter domain-containing protein [Bradyrhizobium liaoningense]|uniref:autotransporter family protein n=1 Tax=Bradyrhizobium liaoningense TaxID=43992 RepID=UPI001BAD666D|nr:autotransporter domain-containing protein [Bradyrhizobium liaoningense]MBR0716456.1 autotransporter domain-containing protein [Bradyrhizobium liaoningense]